MLSSTGLPRKKIRICFKEQRGAVMRAVALWPVAYAARFWQPIAYRAPQLAAAELAAGCSRSAMPIHAGTVGFPRLRLLEAGATAKTPTHLGRKGTERESQPAAGTDRKHRVLGAGGVFQSGTYDRRWVVLVCFSKLWRARSRLYQRRFLQSNTHFAAFFKIYKMS